MSAILHARWLWAGFLLAACGGAAHKPSVGPAEQPAFVTCHAGCGADFDALARGERDVLVRSLDGSHRVRAQLTPEGEQRAKALADQLGRVTLRESYGCPGCADGPVASVTVAGARHSFDPRALDQVEPEAERKALDAAAQLFDDIEAPVTRCESNAWVQPVAPCEPFSAFGR